MRSILVGVAACAVFMGVRALEAGLIWLGYNMLAPLATLPHMTCAMAYGASLLMCVVRSPFQTATEPSRPQVAFYRAVQPALLERGN